MRLSKGQTFRESFNIDAGMIERFAELSGDRNPIHLDAEEAKKYGYHRQVAHGAVLIALLSNMIGMKVSASGAVWMSQSIDWLKPVFVDDTVELAVTIKKISSGTGVVELEVVATNVAGEKVMQGEAKVKVMEKLVSDTAGSCNLQRVALVTGASRGIGAEIARRLAAVGMSVVVNYRQAHDKAKQVVEAIRSADGAAQEIMADLGDVTATRHMIETVIKSFGRIDVVVHGASPGIYSTKISELTYDKLESYLKVYLGGALSLVAGASPIMSKQKFGRFIFLGTAAMFGTPPIGWAGYLAAKEALWAMVKSMAVELGPSGITTNMVSPGLTVTELTADIPIRVKEVQAHRNPIRRLATVQDTAEAVAFLASDHAGYLNGINLPVAGGPL